MLVLKGLVKQYDDGSPAVKGIDLEVRDGEFFTLLGPSGCGKTTTLRLIAGLEEPTAGSIWIGDRDITRVDPGDRNVAMVFQNYALYPHMSVLDNLTLNLRVRGTGKAEARARAVEVARSLGIEALLERKPGQISGGERQRVALGRAIIRHPAVFLLDEPLSNLDLKLRERMRTELKRLHQHLAVTTIYVTHDQSEALVLSDRIAVLNGGQIQQIGSPSEIYERPANRFVSEFIGSPGINLFRGEVTSKGVRVAGLYMDGPHAPIGRQVMVGVRPENVILTTAGGEGLPAVVDFIEHNGSVIFAFLALRQEGEGALVDRDRVVAAVDAHLGIGQHDQFDLLFRPGRVLFFDVETGDAVSWDDDEAAPVAWRKATVR